MSSFAGKSWWRGCFAESSHNGKRAAGSNEHRSFTFDMTLDRNGRTSFKRTSLGSEMLCSEHSRRMQCSAVQAGGLSSGRFA